MDLNEIAIFVQVVQSKSFRLAALKLGMPNSTVSHKVSMLEKRLGITLIQRTTRKLNITPAGESYYRQCLQSLELIRGAEQEIASGQGEPQGNLRITAPMELGSSVLPDLISRYMDRYPKVRVEVVLSDRVVDLMGESIDLAIRAGRLKDSSLIAKKIGSVSVGVYASSKYLKSSSSILHPRDLLAHSCLMFTPFGSDSWKLASSKGSQVFSVNPMVVANDLNLIKRMVLNGDGVAAMPSYFCIKEIQNGKMVRILEDWRSEYTPVHFVYPAQKFVSPKLKSFMDMAMPEIKSAFGGED